MKYEYLPHTADAKFRAFGKDIEEVFRNSAIAMFDILGKTEEVKVTKRKTIKIKAKNLEALLYDFLEEILILLDTEGIFIHDVKKIKISDEFELTAVIEGDDLNNYDLSGDIKAVTYNDMSIKKTNNRYEATVVVDI
ncbi:archease [archaeon]|jgi:SHS2 domain-containing protein|nr:archease [archaeon]MBT6824029.1 archease [archaeon]MBT7107262.1 archease [archaeon]MBT7297183.1 archease [archaeon]